MILTVKVLAFAFLHFLVGRNEREEFAAAFAPVLTSHGHPTFRAAGQIPSTPSSVVLFLSSKSNNPKKSGLEEGVKNKLVKESIAPWRPLRLFMYFALGSGAMIGGLITLSGTLAAMSGVRPDLDLNTEYVNLGIDFGAVAVFALLAKFDLDKKAELDQRLDEKIEKKKEQAKLIQEMKEREKVLAGLSLEIRVSADGDTREAAVRELQAGARQHVIIVAGPKKACRDALVGANLLKMDFALSNVLVVTFETDADPADLASRPVGFGERPMYETQPYVARPTGDIEAWKSYIDAEMKDAIQQNGIKAKDEGIAIVVNNSGKVMRRGVGKVPWRQMVEELEASTKVAS